ncbi:MAG: substrate-binding domain-containing protein [Clostridiales bacterium]|nr:substrate-binding domain-containing protein [Clostridiales bacterium]
MKKTLSLFLVLMLVVGTLSFAAAEGRTYSFEIVSKGFQSTYWQAVLKGCLEETEKLNTEAGYEMIKFNMVGPDSESDIAVQVNEFESALNASPDAIGLAALDVNALNDNIAAAQAAGIPIIGFDSGVPNAPEGAVYANASTNNYVAGTVVAENLYAKIKDRIMAADAPVRIGEINQDATSESITNRGLGFLDKFIELAAADGIKVAVIGNEKYVGDIQPGAVVEADADVVIEVRVPALTTTELCATEAGVVLNEPDTIAIFGSNQVAAEGIITANEMLGVCGTTDDMIIAVGFDSGTVIKAAVRGGMMYGAVTQSPVGIGKVLIDLLLAVSNGEPVEDTDTGCAFYTVDNIDSDEIAPNLYD